MAFGNRGGQSLFIGPIQTQPWNDQAMMQSLLMNQQTYNSDKPTSSKEKDSNIKGPWNQEATWRYQDELLNTKNEILKQKMNNVLTTKYNSDKELFFNEESKKGGLIDQLDQLKYEMIKHKTNLNLINENKISLESLRKSMQTPTEKGGISPNEIVLDENGKPIIKEFKKDDKGNIVPDLEKGFATYSDYYNKMQKQLGYEEQGKAMTYSPPSYFDANAIESHWKDILSTLGETDISTSLPEGTKLDIITKTIKDPSGQEVQDYVSTIKDKTRNNAEQLKSGMERLILDIDSDVKLKGALNKKFLETIRGKESILKDENKYNEEFNKFTSSYLNSMITGSSKYLKDYSKDVTLLAKGKNGEEGGSGLSPVATYFTAMKERSDKLDWKTTLQSISQKANIPNLQENVSNALSTIDFSSLSKLEADVLTQKTIGDVLRKTYPNATDKQLETKLNEIYYSPDINSDDWKKEPTNIPILEGSFYKYVNKETGQEISEKEFQSRQKPVIAIPAIKDANTAIAVQTHEIRKDVSPLEYGQGEKVSLFATLGGTWNNAANLDLGIMITPQTFSSGAIPDPENPNSYSDVMNGYVLVSENDLDKISASIYETKKDDYDKYVSQWNSKKLSDNDFAEQTGVIEVNKEDLVNFIKSDFKMSKEESDQEVQRINNKIDMLSKINNFSTSKMYLVPSSVKSENMLKYIYPTGENRTAATSMNKGEIIQRMGTLTKYSKSLTNTSNYLPTK